MHNFLLLIKKIKLSDWLFILIILFALFLRGPSLFEQYKQQGTKLIPVTINGKLFPPPKNKSVLIFWASWCGPCTIELNRINQAIEKNEISAKNIYAVNLGESEEAVNKVIGDRKFKMAVVIDKNNELANLLKVQGTPTIAFIDKTQTVTWLSSGISPTLIFRIKNFLDE